MSTNIKESGAKGNLSSDRSVVICINCDSPIIDNFCGNCSQPKYVKRITLKTLAVDVYDKLFAMDNKFARTIKDLFIKPGEVIQSFLDGNRVRYFGPAGLYFLVLTVYLLLLSLLDISFEEIAGKSRSIFSPTEMSEKEDQVNQEIFSTLTNNLRIFSFLLIPFFALALKIVFKKRKLNIFEHSSVVFYAFSISTIFSIIFLFFNYFTGYEVFWIQMITGVLVFGFIAGFYYQNNKFNGFLKGLGAYALGYLFIMLISMVGGIIYYIINPSAFH